jgi:hypothetical protein
MPLPDDTKYKVTDALVNMTTAHMVDVFNAYDIFLERMDVTRIDRLNFSVRFKPRDGGAPRYITVKVSEPF